MTADREPDATKPARESGESCEMCRVSAKQPGHEPRVTRYQAQRRKDHSKTFCGYKGTEA